MSVPWGHKAWSKDWSAKGVQQCRAIPAISAQGCSSAVCLPFSLTCRFLKHWKTLVGKVVLFWKCNRTVAIFSCSVWVKIIGNLGEAAAWSQGERCLPCLLQEFGITVLHYPPSHKSCYCLPLRIWLISFFLPAQSPFSVLTHTQLSIFQTLWFYSCYEMCSHCTV